MTATGAVLPLTTTRSTWRAVNLWGSGSEAIAVSVIKSEQP